MTSDFRLDSPIRPMGRISLRDAEPPHAGLILPSAHEPATTADIDLRVKSFEEAVQIPGVEVMLELAGRKAATVISDMRELPVVMEGLLFEHEPLPMGFAVEILLTADGHDVVKEDFELPTRFRDAVMEARRRLAEINVEYLSDTRLRDTAMAVYFPDLTEEYDVWFRVSISESRVLTYSLHIGPSYDQEIKKRIEGSLPL